MLEFFFVFHYNFHEWHFYEKSIVIMSNGKILWYKISYQIIFDADRKSKRQKFASLTNATEKSLNTHFPFEFIHPEWRTIHSHLTSENAYLISGTKENVAHFIQN